MYDGRAWVAADLLVRYRLPVHGAVLEIACGTRHWTAIVSAREEVTTVTALDASPEMIKIARVKAPDATFTCAGWAHIPGKLTRRMIMERRWKPLNSATRSKI